MNILFRADSSSLLGIGHIMRDLVLAKKYRKKGNKIIFATQNLKGNINSQISKLGYDVEILKSNCINELISIIIKLKIDTLILDHYDITFEDEKKIKMKTKIKIISFDDTYQKHYCDVLINHNISANPKKYLGLVPAKCKLKCGSKYTLIRDEFLIEKKKKNIFLAMGGTDSQNTSLKILKILKKFSNLKVNLITTASNQNINMLNKYIKNNKFIKIYVNSNKIAKLMKRSDFAIVSPSVIVHEVIYMELKFIAIKTADNQNDMYNYLVENNYKVVSSINNVKKIKDYIKEML